MKKKRLALGLGTIFLAAALVAGLALTPTRAGQKTSQKIGPQYTADGQLVRPEGYRTWVFVGADLGIEYSPGASKGNSSPGDADNKDAGDFHNVYINPDSYEQYAKTGKFPNGTMLAMENFAAKQREPQSIVSRGRFEAEQSGLAVAVKNSDRPDGSKTVWAYYAFNGKGGTLMPTARAFADAACYQCHLAHADDDNVWVQFYPTLRALKERKN